GSHFVQAAILSLPGVPRRTHIHFLEQVASCVEHYQVSADRVDIDAEISVRSVARFQMWRGLHPIAQEHYVFQREWIAGSKMVPGDVVVSQWLDAAECGLLRFFHFKQGSSDGIEPAIQLRDEELGIL